MPASEARIPTESASRYLVQLCKHWSHKFAVDYSPEAGTIPFPEGRLCTMQATTGLLTMRLEAADAAALEKFEDVLVTHLKRFSFREDLGPIAWSREA